LQVWSAAGLVVAGATPASGLFIVRCELLKKGLTENLTGL